MRGSDRGMLDTTVASGISSIARISISRSTKSVLFTRSQFIGLVSWAVVTTPIRANFQAQNILEKREVRRIFCPSKMPASRTNIISAFVDRRDSRIRAIIAMTLFFRISSSRVIMSHARLPQFHTTSYIFSVHGIHSAVIPA